MSTVPQSVSLDAIFEIAFTLNSIQETDALLEHVLKVAANSLKADRGFILLRNEAHYRGFDIKSTYNLTPSQLNDVVSLSTSVVHRVLQTGEHVVLHKALDDHRFGLSRSIVLQKIRSIACVPLRIKHDQIGAIYMDCLTDRSRFHNDNLPFLEAFSNLAALAIENARLYRATRVENRHLLREMRQAHGFKQIIGQSPRMRSLYDVMHRVLDTDATILINGESGTGKELVARAIHYEGHRKDKPFLTLFCGSLPDNLLESELFGHKKGAFTGAVSDKPGLFEVADGGTLFLDEVGDISPSLQTSLLRVLQEGEVKRIGETGVRHVDVRVISASNKSLAALIEDGSFREDLYYRLNTIPITTPPLRERKEDIPLLAQHFIEKYAIGRRAHIKGFHTKALQAMERYHWPGNVRELQNTIERAVVLTKGHSIGAADLNLPKTNAPLDKKYLTLPPDMTLKELEKRAVQQALEACNGNVSAVAKRLGVSRTWLYSRLNDWKG